MEASCWVAKKIFLSPAMASSRARTLDSLPTTNGVIMNGKMTTSRMGIIGNRFVSDFSFEVSILSYWMLDVGFWMLVGAAINLDGRKSTNIQNPTSSIRFLSCLFEER